MNVGGITPNDGIQSPLKNTGQVEQGAFSQMFASIFSNIQSNSLDGTSSDIPIVESVGSAEKKNMEKSLINTIVPFFTGLTPKGETSALKDIEKWITEIVYKSNDTLKTEDTMISQLLNSSSEIGEIYRQPDKDTNMLPNIQQVPDSNTFEVNTKIEALIGIITGLAKVNAEQALQTDKSLNEKNISEIPEAGKSTIQTEEQENIESIIEGLSTVIVQFIQENILSKNEHKMPQNAVYEVMADTVQANTVYTKLQAGFESGPKLANAVLEDHIDSSVHLKDGMKSKEMESVLTVEYVSQDTSREPNHFTLLDTLVNQVKDKLQANNPKENITVEDVLNFIKEVDFKKVIDDYGTLESFSRKNAAVNTLKNDNPKEVPELFISRLISDNNEAATQILKSTGNASTNKTETILNKSDIQIEPEMLTPITANINRKISEDGTYSNIDGKHDLKNAKADDFGHDIAFKTGNLKLDLDDKNEFKGDFKFKEGLSHITVNSEVKAQGEAELSKPDEVKNLPRYEKIIEAAVKGFKSLKLPEINELNVKLKPDELGEIVVKVVLEKGQINGSITAEKKDVVNILQNQVDNLKQELKNNNVNVNSISVNIGNEQQGSSHQGYFNQNTKRERRNFESVLTKDLNEDQDKGFEIIA